MITQIDRIIAFGITLNTLVLEVWFSVCLRYRDEMILRGIFIPLFYTYSIKASYVYSDSELLALLYRTHIKNGSKQNNGINTKVSFRLNLLQMSLL